MQFSTNYIKLLSMCFQKGLSYMWIRDTKGAILKYSPRHFYTRVKGV